MLFSRRETGRFDAEIMRCFGNHSRDPLSLEGTRFSTGPLRDRRVQRRMSSTFRKSLMTVFTIVTMLCFVSVSVSAPAPPYNSAAVVATNVETPNFDGELSVNSSSFEKSDHSAPSGAVITNTVRTNNSELEELSHIWCMTHRPTPPYPRDDRAGNDGMESTMLRDSSGYLASIFRPPDVTSR